MDNNTILLVTATLRTDNLPAIAENIVSRFSGQTTYTPFWVICLDQYHADTNTLKIKKLEVYLLEHSIQYKIYYQGSADSANYGGALMNAPLQDIKNHYAGDSNPWIYVLDDDNIISRNFIRFLNTYTSKDDTIWMMNMLDEYGSHVFSRKADRLAYINGTGPNAGYRIIHPCAACDPSQLLIRLNKFLEIGGFDSIRAYDFKFMTKIYMNAGHIDDLLKCQGTFPWFRNPQQYFLSCYHNGLVQPDAISDTINELQDDDTNDSYVRVHTRNHLYNIELSNDELLEILQKRMKNEKK